MIHTFELYEGGPANSSPFMNAYDAGDSFKIEYANISYAGVSYTQKYHVYRTDSFHIRGDIWGACSEGFCIPNEVLNKIQTRKIIGWVKAKFKVRYWEKTASGGRGSKKNKYGDCLFKCEIELIERDHYATKTNIKLRYNSIEPKNLNDIVTTGDIHSIDYVQILWVRIEYEYFPYAETGAPTYHGVLKYLGEQGTVRVKVKNTSNYRGNIIIKCQVKSPSGSWKGYWIREWFNPGEEKSVTFTMPERDEYFNREGYWDLKVEAYLEDYPEIKAEVEREEVYYVRRYVYTGVVSIEAFLHNGKPAYRAKIINTSDRAGSFRLKIKYYLPGFGWQDGGYRDFYLQPNQEGEYTIYTNIKSCPGTHKGEAIGIDLANDNTVDRSTASINPC